MSQRHLVLRQIRRRIQDFKNNSLHTETLNYEGADEDLRQIYSSYCPSLPTDSYEVIVKQSIEAPSGSSISFNSSKKFDVVAPRFNLPSDAIHSSYPPQGHHDTLEILPHVVFNDPHLPWARAATKSTESDSARNRVPWFVLLTVTSDELQIPTAILSELSAQSPSITEAIHSKISDIQALKDISTPLSCLQDAEGEADIIFLDPKLFNAYVTTFDSSGMPDTSQQHPDVSRYKHLVHARKLKTSGMAESGAEDMALKSIVISHRVAPLDSAQPVTIVAHLISIEGVEDMSFPVDESHPVALVSLYSWVYTALPPKSLNTHDLFENIGRSIDLLRAPVSVISHQLSPRQRINPLSKLISPWLEKRLGDGYTLTKYRPRTGEITAAITRGAFTPTLIPHPLTAGWTSISNSGESLQIIDPNVGLLDISYSTAWNLGKSMAIGDQVFSAALCRVRSAIYNSSMNDVKTEILEKRRAFCSHICVIKSFSNLASELRDMAAIHPQGHQISRQQHRMRSSRVRFPSRTQERWNRIHPTRIDFSLRASHVKRLFPKHVSKRARKLASSLEDENVPYDEINTPYSMDWALIFKWILDKMYLSDIPTHYLITDPSYLPPESLRFFHIDLNWIDAFIDGALSISNHIGTDTIRCEIKKQINNYLNTVNPEVGYKPQIPTYGFLLRSNLVTIFPDLKVTVSPVPDNGRAPILRQENVAPGVLLCLLDRVPSEEFSNLTFTQPPHQLLFAAAASLDSKSFTTDYRRVYTKEVYDPNRAKILSQHTWTRDDTTEDPVFLWGDSSHLRMLLFPKWAENVFTTIRDGMKNLDDDGKDHSDWFLDTIPSSALNAIQLANPAYHLKIALPEDLKEDQGDISTTQPMRTLQLLETNEHWTEDVSDVEFSGADFDPYQKPRPQVALLTPRRLERQRTKRIADLAMPKHMRSPQFPPLLQYKDYPEASTGRSFQQKSSDTQDLPELNFSVWTQGREMGKPIPSKTDTPLDLIFSILVTPSTNTYSLVELRLTIFLGPADPYDSKPKLMDNYSGPGATMLSNLRFYSLVQFNPDKNKRSLSIRILPRSRTGLVKMEMVKEMSFCLAMVDVNEYDEDTTVNIDYVAKYDSKKQDNKFPVVLNSDTTL